MSRRNAIKAPDKPKKDAWDKAQIISGFLASVVIAVVGLLINSAIQRAQIKSSEENTKAQIEVAKSNNDAQLHLSERTAEVQRQIQQSTLTGQLVFRRPKPPADRVGSCVRRVAKFDEGVTPRPPQLSSI